MPIPRLYVILDAATLLRAGLSLLPAADALLQAGVELIQYRDKLSDDATFLGNARQLAALVQGSPCRLILNDACHLVDQSGAAGAHIGQRDTAPGTARQLVGSGRLLGISTHNQEQVICASGTDADYLAIGPVFGTSSKQDPEPSVGLEGVALARSATAKPLVGIGGISEGNAVSVMTAGADSVAVIGAVLGGRRPVREAAEILLAALRV